MGGQQSEVLEGLLLGPLARSLVRRQSRIVNIGQFPDLDELEFTLAVVNRYLEALDGIAPRKSRPPT